MTLFPLKVSRPGLWFQTLWLYLLPTAGRPELISSWKFWLGVSFVTLPLNLLVYGWNDIVDFEIDQANPRKDSWIFGARGTREQLRKLPPVMAASLAPYLAVLTVIDLRLAAILLAMVAVNALYNAPQRGLRTRPPLELLNQLGYLLILPFGSILNHVPHVKLATVGYLALFCTHAHLIGEIMDVEPDRAAGRRTTATVLGVVPTKLIVVALVALEGAIMIGLFKEQVLGTFLLLGALWLLADAIRLHPGSRYSPLEYRLLGMALNLAGFSSIGWIWFRGGLT